MEFTDAMNSHLQIQQELCQRHADSINNVAETLTETVASSHSKQEETLDELHHIHTDEQLEHSPAEAIRHIRWLREACLHMCKFGKNLPGVEIGEMRSKVSEHCDELEQILNGQQKE